MTGRAAPGGGERQRCPLDAGSHSGACWGSPYAWPGWAVDQSTQPPPPTPKPSIQTTAKPSDAQPIQLTSGFNAPPLAGPMPTGPANGMPAGMGGGQPGAPDGPPRAPDKGALPRELAMRSHPPYVVEPPDILLIDTIRMVPRSPYVVSALDVLNVRLAVPLPNQPIDGQFTVGPDGTVNRGYAYGVVRLGGLTLGEAERVIRLQLKRAGLADPQLFIGLAQFRGVQHARGVWLRPLWLRR